MTQGALAGGITPMILIRHGETTWNRAGRLQGQTDSPLSDLGRSQAEATAKLLSGETIDTILSSDLGRTRDTAAAIAQATGAQVLFDARLRERSYGELEGHTWAEVEHKFPEAWRRMNAREPDFAPSQGGKPAGVFRSRGTRAHRYCRHA